MHHFFTKRMSSSLRYEDENLIKLCNGCHSLHHKNNDPRIHGTVMVKRGLKWYKNLLILKEKKVKISKSYYRDMIEKYKL